MYSVFKPEEFDFVAKVLVYGLDQKLSSCKFRASTGISKELSIVSKFWQQNVNKISAPPHIDERKHSF